MTVTERRIFYILEPWASLASTTRQETRDRLLDRILDSYSTATRQLLDSYWTG